MGVRRTIELDKGGLKQRGCEVGLDSELGLKVAVGVGKRRLEVHYADLDTCVHIVHVAQNIGHNGSEGGGKGEGSRCQIGIGKARTRLNNTRLESRIGSLSR